MPQTAPLSKLNNTATEYNPLSLAGIQITKQLNPVSSVIIRPMLILPYASLIQPTIGRPNVVPKLKTALKMLPWFFVNPWQAA